MPDALDQTYGGVTFSTVAGDVSDGQLFSVGDPIRDRLADLFSAAIVAELTAAWDVARVGTALASTAVVADTTYEQPRAAAVKESGYKYPLLAVYRTGQAEHEWHTLRLRQMAQDWRVDYILGPLRAADFRRLGGVLPWVVKTIDATIENFGHGSFDSGATQFGATRGRLASLAMTSSEEGLAEFTQGDASVQFYAASMTLRSLEVEDLSGGTGTPTDFDGVNYGLDVEGYGDPAPADDDIDVLIEHEIDHS